MRRREWDRKAQGKALYTRTEDYANEVSRLYSKAVNDLLALRKKYKLNDNKEFLYENDPKVAEEAQAILRSLYSAVYSAVTNDIKLEWNKANEEIDGFVKSTFGKQTLKEIGNNGWFERNTDALDAFLKRSNNGMNLSQRIWKYTDQFKDEMEMAMTVAIGEGASAQHISKLVRKYLVEPDKLFRKVRTSTNEDGTPKYRLSKNAALYHPGRGVYRSSYKNAMRLTRTETNMAYRNADHERLQKLDFVIGVRINLSRSHPEPDICDTLAGDYPKGFKFTGWHPQCFCYATTILIDDKTNKEYIKASLRGKKMDLSKYQITDVPQAYKTWVKDNSERITNALHGKGELPYFLRDNGTVNDEGEYVIDAFDIPQQEESSIQPLSLAEIAERRHEARTETQIVDIKARWNEREEKLKALEKVQDLSSIPTPLLPKSAYLMGENYTFDTSYFALVDKKRPIIVEIRYPQKGEKGSYYSPSENKVVLLLGKRHEASNWGRKSVVYHEFGHAIDWQRGLRDSEKLLEMRKKQKERLFAKTGKTIWKKELENLRYVWKKEPCSEIEYINDRLIRLYYKIDSMKDSTFEKLGITKSDVQEQIASTADVLQSFDVKYGWGHKKTYMKKAENAKTEYLAHAFENTFIGNKVFKKVMPDMYEEMVAYIKELKPIQ